MKILIVNKFLHPNGGSETYIFKLGEQLQALGHEVQYFGMEHEDRCVGNSAEQYTVNMDFHGGSVLKKLTYPVKTIYSAEAKRKMKLVLDDFKPDIIHINNFNYQLTPSILYAADDYKKSAGKKVKIVYTAHDGQLVCPNHLMFDSDEQLCDRCLGGKFTNCAKHNCIHGSKAKSVIGTAEAMLYRRLGTYKYIDAIICCSEFMKNKLDTYSLLKDKTTVLHNFVDVPKVDNAEKKGYVLYFGRYGKEKGVETLLETKGVNFVAAGSGEFEEQINAAEHIENIGFKSGDELAEIIAGAACTVCPSICTENCPFSVMESIALGTPVVGSNIGGIPELIENGKTGVLFKRGDSADFERAINEVLEKSDEMSKNCRDAGFDTLETYCEKLMKIYTE